MRFSTIALRIAALSMTVNYNQLNDAQHYDNLQSDSLKALSLTTLRITATTVILCREY
jgi:hypothetical protein